MNAVELAEALLDEARYANERRVLTVAGTRDQATVLVERVLGAIDVPIGETVALTPAERFQCAHVEPDRSTTLMGTTRTVVVLDLHHTTRPNVIGRAAGAVDGGGLLILMCPSLSDWPDRRDAFDEGLVVEPYAIEDVRGLFKRRLVVCLETHPGVAIVDAASGAIERDGLTDPAAYATPLQPEAGRYGTVFDQSWYDRCLTVDQAQTLETFEQLVGDSVAIVVSAERGRGKSSAAGLAAATLAKRGHNVGVTAPERSNLRAFFSRVNEMIDDGELDDGEILASDGGVVQYLKPLDAVSAADRGTIDVLFVDEAAGLPVRTLERFLACPQIAFMTTRHGYEGSGHGFATRFRDRLERSNRPVVDVTLNEPIRYARSDPIESFVNRLLLLDSRPPVEAVVDEAREEDVAVVRPSAETLSQNDERLRAIMGLLATAHYRTEPDDLARVLDAPNLSVIGLETDGHLVSAALIAREGSLPPERVEAAYRGERLRGNMLPDIFCEVFRDDQLASEPGARIVRIATHPAVRRRGFGSRLLAEVREELDEAVSWLGTGFGATPEIVRFWTTNGFVPIAISASRNRASGSHSAILLDQMSCEDGAIDRLTATFHRRIRDSLSDVHRSVESAVVSELLAAIPAAGTVNLSDEQWRALVAAADGPGSYEHDPGSARDLALVGLVDDEIDLDSTTRQMVIAKVLQGHSWEQVAADEGFEATSVVKRQLGSALIRLLDVYGPPLVAKERQRLEGFDE